MALNASAPLNVLALGDSWENVHPDVIRITGGFAGYPYWMAFTPYPLGDDRMENPSIRASRDGLAWEKIPGIPDPLIPAPAESDVHHADPELMHFHGRLNLLYLTIRRKTYETWFNLTECGEDLSWSEPRSIPIEAGVVSPTFQADGLRIREWFIKDHALFSRQGPDFFSLGDDRSCSAEIPGHVPWHVDVLKTEEGYEALIAAFPTGSNSSRTRLYHLTSEDGLAFTLGSPAPVIRPSLLGWDNRMIYRSSFLKEEGGTYRIWYSGSSWGKHFGIGLLEGPLDSLREPRVDHAHLPSFASRFWDDMVGRLRYAKSRVRSSG